MITAPLRDTQFNLLLMDGHRERTGHPMIAHEASPDGIVWATVRECCGDTDAGVMPKPWREVTPEAAWNNFYGGAA